MAKGTDNQELVTLELSEAASRSEYLLDVAAQTFLEQGFEGTSMGEIARRARASKETFYSKYTNKNELFRTVMSRLMGRFTSRLISALEAEGQPDVVLTSFGNIVLDRALSDEGIGLQKIIYMEASRFPEIAKVFYELGPFRTKSALAGYFTVQVEKGNMRKMDAELASAHFMALLTSDLMIRRSLGMLSKVSAEEKTYRINSAVAVFLRAYGPQ